MFVSVDSDDESWKDAVSSLDGNEEDMITEVISSKDTITEDTITEVRL